MKPSPDPELFSHRTRTNSRDGFRVQVEGGRLDGLDTIVETQEEVDEITRLAQQKE